MGAADGGLALRGRRCELGRKRSGGQWVAARDVRRCRDPLQRVCGTFDDDELRPREAPERTFKGSHVAFPSLPTSLLSFSEEEIKETGQEVAR